MKRIALIRPTTAAALALFVNLPAMAQGLGTGIPLNQETAKTPEEIEKQRKIEEAYKATMQKIPDAKAQNDPWGGMRTTDSTKPAQAKPKTITPKKTNSVAN